MTTPLPADPPAPFPPMGAHLTAVPEPGTLRILPVPDTEPDHDPDPYWARPRLAAVPGQLPLRWYPSGGVDDDTDPPYRPPGAQRAAWLLINGYLEVLAGRRPASQLAGTATADAARQLSRVAPDPRRRLRLYRLHVTEQQPGRADVVVLLDDVPAGRVSAIGMLLVHTDGGWRCADFQSCGEPARAVGVPRGTRAGGRPRRRVR